MIKMMLVIYVAGAWLRSLQMFCLMDPRAYRLSRAPKPGEQEYNNLSGALADREEGIQ